MGGCGHLFLLQFPVEYEKHYNDQSLAEREDGHCQPCSMVSIKIHCITYKRFIN